MAEFGGFGGASWFGSGPQKPIAALGVVATLVLIRTQDGKTAAKCRRPSQSGRGSSRTGLATRRSHPVPCRVRR